MTGKEALENLKEINRKQNNGNGDLWLESMVIEPIEKDLEQKELLETELKLEKDKVKYVMKQLEKQDKILNSLSKNADYEVLRLLLNKNVKIGHLKYSFMQVQIWDGDIDYGLETYNNEVTSLDVLTKEEYVSIYNYIKEQKGKVITNAK